MPHKMAKARKLAHFMTFTTTRSKASAAQTYTGACTCKGFAAAVTFGLYDPKEEAIRTAFADFIRRTHA